MDKKLLGIWRVAGSPLLQTMTLRAILGLERPELKHLELS